MNGLSSGGDKMKLIAMLHLCPLEAFRTWSPVERARYEEDLIADVEVLRQGGVRNIMVENNFDYEHDASLGDLAAIFEHLLELVWRKLNGSGINLGVCCRWADWRSTFRFVRQFGLSFCRLPLVGLEVTIRSGKTIETTFNDIEAEIRASGPGCVMVLCDLIPKNCQISHPPKDLGKRVAELKTCGGTGVVIGERQSGQFLSRTDYAHLELAQGDWAIPAYVAGSVDEQRANALSAVGVGVIVGGFIYSRRSGGWSAGLSPIRVDAAKVKRVVTAVHTE